MNEDKSTLLQDELGQRNAPDYASLLPDELSQDQAFQLLGQRKPPTLDEVLPQGSSLRSDFVPTEMSSDEAMQFATENGLDTNIDLNDIPDELSMEQAADLVRKLGTQSIGVGVPEVGKQKSSGLASSGFYGALPQIAGGRITQGFGAAANYERNGKHNGVDIAAPKGTPIPSVEDGVVMVVEDNGKKGFGKSVVIENSDGSYSRYSHLNSFGVKQGQSIKRGAIIGGMGNTGYVIPLGGGTGVHLDYRRSK
ncbi:MAG: M23 family metallopeptidase [Candidatus Berkelbacteria bacterium]|nr:M23 family metallopeptidase [Candidatus Berkelbacteria bacterium]